MRDPVEVVHEALLAPVPCSKCGKPNCRCLFARAGRLKNQAAMIVMALVVDGHMHAPEPDEPTGEDFDDLAQHLADASQHPRYVQIHEGWRKLLESEADISVAHAAALKTLGTPSPEQATDLGRVRDTLVAEVRKRRAAQDPGA